MAISNEVVNMLLNIYCSIVLTVICWLLIVGYRMMMDIHREVKRQ